MHLSLLVLFPFDASWKAEARFSDGGFDVRATRETRIKGDSHLGSLEGHIEIGDPGESADGVADREFAAGAHHSLDGNRNRLGRRLPLRSILVIARDRCRCASTERRSKGSGDRARRSPRALEKNPVLAIDDEGRVPRLTVCVKRRIIQRVDHERESGIELLRES